MGVSVIGAGSWGTTLASILAESTGKSYLWARREEVAQEINYSKTNKTYLDDAEINPGVFALTDISKAAEESEYLVIAVPSKYFRSVIESLKPFVRPEHKFLSTTKGIEQDTLKRMSEILVELLEAGEDRIAVLSGPNHAEEVIRKIPSATVIASKNPELAREFQNLLMRPYFRVYIHTDVTGVEVAATVKNVIAIAAGISDGLGYGDNTKASLITRGLAEMVRLGKVCGAQPSTFLGLAGVGDLVATATSRHSRNRNFGERVGRGEKIEEILSSSKMIVEGVTSAKSVVQLADRYKIDMPITREVYEIIYNGKDPKLSVSSLMEREPKAESDF